MKNRVRTNRGYSLILVLVLSAISGIVMVATSKLLISAAQVERTVTSNTERNHIGNTLSLILQNKDSCSRSGIVGQRLGNGSIPQAAIELTTIFFPTETPFTAAFAKTGEMVSSTRKAQRIVLNNLQRIGNANPGASLVFATLELYTAPVGGGNTGKNSLLRLTPLSIPLNLEVDNGSRQILACYQVGSGGSGSNNTPAPQPEPVSPGSNLVGFLYYDATTGRVRGQHNVGGVQEVGGRGGAPQVSFCSPENFPLADKEIRGVIRITWAVPMAEDVYPISAVSAICPKNRTDWLMPASVPPTGQDSIVQIQSMDKNQVTLKVTSLSAHSPCHACATSDLIVSVYRGQ